MITHLKWLCGLSLALAAPAAAGEPPTVDPGFRFPTVPADRPHARALLANALRYLGPDVRIFDAESGYPVEGWNQDPEKGLFLRSFTQLTAIGQGMEILANVAAGLCETPFLSRKDALARLSQQTRSLLKDQADPTLAADGLLGNFLDLATGERLGPLASDVELDMLADALGAPKAEAVWKALAARDWIKPREDGREAEIVRSASYGWEHFDGPLEPFADNDARRKIMDVLDRRVVMVVFVDNANLSSSLARCIGALSRPAVKDDPAAVAIRDELERFLEAQRDGYARLHDPAAGMFYFGRDATRNRLFGWRDLEGKWVDGHVDYLVNELRGPAAFVVARFGAPIDAVANLGFKLRPYATADGRTLRVLAPWEGSAFQGLGFELAMTELDRPSWRRLLSDFVAVEIDYSTRHKLPGFLSEAYSGRGTQYTGSIGIPEITVSPEPRITDAPSLYTLGPAYSVAPAAVEAFLAANWPDVSSLMTDHGPWEGFDATRRQPITFQTSAHTFSLVLGLLGTASDHMKIYLESKGMAGRLDALFPDGAGADLLSDAASAFAWDAKDRPIESGRDGPALFVRSPRIAEPGVAFVARDDAGVDLSGTVLTLRSRLKSDPVSVTIALKPVKTATNSGPHVIPTEIAIDLPRGDSGAIAIQLPAAPGLSHVKEVVLTFAKSAAGKPLDLAVLELSAAPPR